MPNKKPIHIIDLPTTDPQGTVLEIEVSWSDGGTNYFHGTMNNPKGMGVRVTPVEKKTSSGGFVMRSFMMFSGKGILVKQLDRFSRKAMEEFAAEVKKDLTPYHHLIRYVMTKNNLALADDTILTGEAVTV